MQALLTFYGARPRITLYIGYQIFNIRLSFEVGKTMQKKKMKDISRYGTKGRMLEATEFAHGQFLVSCRERTGQWGFILTS